jgi:hypothetical protein
MRHRHPRWVDVVIAAAVAAVVIGIGVSAMAATDAAQGNYRGPARTTITHPSVIKHQSNYRGPARKPARVATVPGRHSNLPAQKGSN